jgi:hypothetical protein
MQSSLTSPRWNQMGRSGRKARKLIVTPALRLARAQHLQFLKEKGLPAKPRRNPLPRIPE